MDGMAAGARVLAHRAGMLLPLEPAHSVAHSWHGAGPQGTGPCPAESFCCPVRESAVTLAGWPAEGGAVLRRFLDLILRRLVGCPIPAALAPLAGPRHSL